MIKLDYKRRDFKEIKNNNETRYFIWIKQEYIEIPVEVFKVIKADYLNTHRTNKKDIERIQGNFVDDSVLIKHMPNTIYDMDHHYIEQISKWDNIQNLLKAMEHLDEEQYFIIHSLFFEEQTEAAVAQKLGISQQALNKRKKKILLFLKKWL